MGTNQHVTPHPNGGWQVKGEGKTRATRVTSTKKEAESIARNKRIPKGIKMLIIKPSQTFLQNQKDQNTIYTMVAISIFKEQQ